MAEAFNCAFARASIYHKEGISKHGHNIKSKFEHFKNLFEDFTIDKKVFDKKVRDIQLTFRRWRSKNREQFLDVFSPSKWKELDIVERQKHTLKNCLACQRNPVSHFFPTQKMFNKKQPFNPTSIKETFPPNLNAVKGTRKEIKEATRVIYNTVNNEFKKHFSCEFVDVLVTIPELNIAKKQSKAKKKATKRISERRYKSHCEETMAKTDANALLSSRQSFNQRQVIRRLTYFESTEEAAQRTKKRKLEEELEGRQTKRHCRQHQKLNFDKAKLIEEVNNLPDDAKVRNTFK